MSCYDWEKGTFVLSTSEFGRFKKVFFETLNKRIADEFLTMTRLYETLLAAGKGKRGFDWKQGFEKLFNEVEVSGYSSWGRTTRKKFDFQLLEEYAIEHAILFKQVANPRMLTPDGKPRLVDVACAPRKPLKKDFPLHAVSKATHATGDCNVFFEPKTRKISWYVPEGNRAVERAHDSFVGGLFFRTLGTVTWTRATGGSIVGNDEYRQESQDAGEGANEVKETYGPLGEKARDLQHLVRQCRSPRRTVKSSRS